MSANPRILVVDDQPINIRLLKRVLEKQQMEVVTAENGRECLQRVAENLPDLILLDVMMPDMDGFEVCQELQRKEETRSIPVIFITAETRKEGKLQGLEAGAVDYITKPIDIDETLARVQTQLRFQAINKENVELQTRLGEARRAAAIGAITQGIAHNLNNLLGVVVGYIDLTKTSLNNPEAAQRNLGRIESAVNRMVEIIKQLTSVSTRSRPPLGLIDVADSIGNAIARFHREFSEAIPVEVDNLIPEARVCSNAEVLEDVLVKLLFNAAESYEPTSLQRPIHLRIDREEREGIPVIAFKLSDKGRGIPEDIRDHIFDAFISSKRTVGVGMGLTVARHSIRNLGGDLTLTAGPQGGTTAIFHLPVQKNKNP
ncbi:MAG: response regulator [Opitutaceae bacterium]